MYRALYRKWRPQRFADVVGQPSITAALANQIEAGRVGHAYLFTGTRGTGKTTCAKIFAKAVNCEKPQGAEPCGECAACTGIDNGSILDVIEIDAASNNSVDDVRDLRDETAYRPSYCKYKVYIIDEVHMLSAAAWAALLKIMEEPPSHVLFILATTEIHKVPATILSRCQRFDFLRIPAEAMAERLVQVAQAEQIDLAPEAADLIARLADGALRDALSLLDTCAGLGGPVDDATVRRMAGVVDKGYLFSLSDAVAAGDRAELMTLVAGLRQQSVDVKRLCEELVFHYRAHLLARAKPDGSLLERMPKEERARYVEAAKEVDEAFAICAVRRLAAAMEGMSRSADPAVDLELALFDLSMPEDANTAGAGAGASMVKNPQKSAKKMAITSPTQAATTAAQGDDKSAGMPLKSDETRREIPVSPKPEARNDTEEEQQREQITEENGEETPEEITGGKIPENQQVLAPATVQEGTLQPFEQWSQVVEVMAGMDRMLYTYMKGSSAYLDGGRVLIDGGDMFLTYMREYSTATPQIKQAIEQVTGRRHAIGPYTQAATEEKKQPTAQDTLQELAAKGVVIEYENQ